MHEFSVVRALLNQVDQIVKQHEPSRVTEIRMSVGDFAGVDARLLQSAFDQLAPRHPDGDARLVVRKVPLQAQCRACRESFIVERFRFVCPTCHGTDTTVVSGEELVLESITLEAKE